MNKNPKEDMNTQLQQPGEDTTALSTNNQLTIREKEVLRMIADGEISSEIADRLFVCLDTVETHRKNIIKKLKVKNMPHAVAHAFRKNLFH